MLSVYFLNKIFNHLDIASLLKKRAVCKQWMNIIQIYYLDKITKQPKYIPRQIVYLTPFRNLNQLKLWDDDAPCRNYPVIQTSKNIIVAGTRAILSMWFVTMDDLPKTKSLARQKYLDYYYYCLDMSTPNLSFDDVFCTYFTMMHLSVFHCQKYFVPVSFYDAIINKYSYTLNELAVGYTEGTLNTEYLAKCNHLIKIIVFNRDIISPHAYVKNLEKFKIIDTLPETKISLLPFIENIKKMDRLYKYQIKYAVDKTLLTRQFSSQDLSHITYLFQFGHHAIHSMEINNYDNYAKNFKSHPLYIHWTKKIKLVVKEDAVDILNKIFEDEFKMEKLAISYKKSPNLLVEILNCLAANGKTFFANDRLKKIILKERANKNKCDYSVIIPDAIKKVYGIYYGMNSLIMLRKINC